MGVNRFDGDSALSRFIGGLVDNTHCPMTENAINVIFANAFNHLLPLLFYLFDCRYYQYGYLTMRIFTVF